MSVKSIDHSKLCVVRCSGTSPDIELVAPSASKLSANEGFQYIRKGADIAQGEEACLKELSDFRERIEECDIMFTTYYGGYISKGKLWSVVAVPSDSFAELNDKARLGF
ncbi:hypothetical protein A0H81_02151 [Grifola frondosa]|uniref:Uncharacterized protein n=1 Tax=Grifola frondosa TaxID=5627 RepID=A0A1C7MSA5_GRIFR|nr:hypothetical protein A0H81_02151 [Grifola frondosa]